MHSSTILALATASTLACALACSPTTPAGGDDETGDGDPGDGDPGDGDSGDGDSGDGDSGDGDSGDGDGDAEELRSDAPHEQDPALDDGEAAALAAANHALTLDLYHAVRDGEVADLGFAVSAYSLTSAFGMLHAGSVEPARAQIAEALHFPLAGEQQHVAHNWLDAQLESRNIAPGELGEGDGLTLRTANGLWLLDSLAAGVSTEFLDTLAIHYDAGLGLADFAGDPESERERINAWVSDRTNALIPSLFPADSINIYTTLVLANALYLNAPWAAPFVEGYTQTRDFTRLDAQIVSVEMMRAPAVTTSYATAPGYEAVALPLLGSKLEVVLILPTDFAGFEAALDSAKLTEILTGFESTLLDLSVPRFELGTELELSEELEGLGMVAPFSDMTSFDGIHPEVDTIEVVVHNTVIKVDEDGLEAAAASGIGGDGDGDPDPDPEPPIVVVFDRPFLIAVHDYPTNTLLFFGRVLDPS